MQGVQLVELKNRSNHFLFHLMNLTSLIMIQLEGWFWNFLGSHRGYYLFFTVMQY